MDDVPENIRIRAIHHLSDGIGVALAAAGEGTLRRAADQFAPAIPGGKCELIPGGGTSSPSQAALVNGMAAHIYDFDDTRFLGVVHGTAVVCAGGSGCGPVGGSYRQDISGGLHHGIRGRILPG